MDSDSASVAATVAAMRCVVSAEADDADAMRPRVSSATWLSVEQVAVSEPDASLIASTTSPMASANSAIASSMAPRRAAAACSAAWWCSVMALATSKLTDLRYNAAALGDLGGGEAVPARQPIERLLEHIAAGDAAHAGVEPDRGLPLHSAPAHRELIAIELAAEQGAKVRHFEFFEQLHVPADDVADVRHHAHGCEHLFDRLVEFRLDQRPAFGKDAPRPVVEAVDPKASLEGLHEIGRRHGGKVSKPPERRMVCENRCSCVNELVTN